MIHFVARAAAVVEADDVIVVVFREGADGGGDGIEVQRALVFDEQDRSLGMDTYCVSTSDGQSCYGGVSSRVLVQDVLTIGLTDEAAATFGTNGFQLELAVSVSAIDEVRFGLAQVFEGFVPEDLRIH